MSSSEIIQENHAGRAVLSVVVPVFNSAAMLNTLSERLESALNATGMDFELLLVDDGSRDASWTVIQEMARDRRWIHGINLMRNYGQHNALLCGIRAARGDIIVTIDDDLQNPPDQIHLLLDKLAEGWDVVYGISRTKQHGFLRGLATSVSKLALRASMGVNIASHVGPFRAFRAHLRDAFKEYNSPHVSIDVLLTWGTTRFAVTPVRHDPRLQGSSNYTIRKLITHAFNMMTSFTMLPLQLASILGFMFSVFGAFVLVFVLARYIIYGRVVPGFAFLASIIAVFSGVQLFSLGIIGEYLARMHFRMLECPPYAVRGRAGGAEDKGPLSHGNEGSAHAE